MEELYRKNFVKQYEKRATHTSLEANYESLRTLKELKSQTRNPKRKALRDFCESVTSSATS